MRPKRTVTESQKKRIAGRQFYRCANSPDKQLIGLENHKCLLWKIQDSNQGIFDESGYEIDHIIEHSVSKDDRDANLQALCVSCHKVKTKRFNSNKKKGIQKKKVANKNTITIDLTEYSEEPMDISE